VAALHPMKGVEFAGFRTEVANVPEMFTTCMLTDEPFVGRHTAPEFGFSSARVK
jgi:hypothetical protein